MTEFEPVLVGDPRPPCALCCMRRDGGRRRWVCLYCGRRQPFNEDGEE